MLNFMFAQRYALIYSMLALILVVETTRALHSECVSSHSFITFYQLLCSALLFIVGSDGFRLFSFGGPHESKRGCSVIVLVNLIR